MAHTLDGLRKDDVIHKKSWAKVLFFSLVALLVGILIVAAWRLHMRSSQSTYVSSCSAYGGTFDSIGPESIQKFAKDSRAIVVATVEDPKALGTSVHMDDTAPRIKVTRVLKGGNELRANDSISICPGMGYLDLPEGDHPTILVFLEGKENDVWVPNLGYFGIIPKNKDGRFTVTSIEGSKTVSVDELKKLIK